MKLNFSSTSKCYSYIFYTPKTQLPFELKVLFIHFLTRELKMEGMKLNFPSTSKCHSHMFNTPKTEDGLIHLLPPRKLKTECMKLNFSSTSKCYSYIFYTPKTQLPFELKVLFIHFLDPRTQNGRNETQLPFDLKVSLTHV